MRMVVAIFDHGSITHAANSLKGSQAYFSRSLREIEDQLGFKLFERHRRGLRPTILGTLVVGWARTILHEMDQADRELDEFRAKLGRLEAESE